MKVGVPKEILPGERRVALVPATVASLLKAGA
jgi:alanine dehydrogenase